MLDEHDAEMMSLKNSSIGGLTVGSSGDRGKPNVMSHWKSDEDQAASNSLKKSSEKCLDEPLKSALRMNGLPALYDDTDAMNDIRVDKVCSLTPDINYGVADASIKNCFSNDNTVPSVSSATAMLSNNQPAFVNAQNVLNSTDEIENNHKIFRKKSFSSDLSDSQNTPSDIDRDGGLNCLWQDIFKEAFAYSTSKNPLR